MVYVPVASESEQLCRRNTESAPVGVVMVVKFPKKLAVPVDVPSVPVTAALAERCRPWGGGPSAACPGNCGTKETPATITDINARSIRGTRSRANLRPRGFRFRPLGWDTQRSETRPE